MSQPPDLDRRIIEELYQSQGLPAPDWSRLDHACRQALLAGIHGAAGRPGLLSRELVEDLMQDTRLRLYAHDYRALRGMQGPMPGALLGLLKTMATNTTYDHFRYRQSLKRDAKREIALDQCDRLPSPQSMPEQTLMLRAVEQALPCILPPGQVDRYRRIFWLYHRECYSAREIAALPGIRLTTKGVESALKRMMTGLRVRFGTLTPAAA